LAIKIRNSNIQGIRTPNNSNTTEVWIKIKQLADDTTLFLKNKEDMDTASDFLKRFETFSGLKINLIKTKALKMGKQPNEPNLPFAVVNKIKILGIYFESNKMAKNIEDNWKGRIECIQRMIRDWSKRDLSIHGKIVVIKTFLVSQLIFVMQAIGIQEYVLNEINTMLYKFVWQRKHSNKRAFEKVKRKVMESDYQLGGLKMINLLDLQKHIYLQWAGRLFSAAGENWSVIPRWHLSKILNQDGSFFINCRAKRVQPIDDLDNNFWRTKVLPTYLNNKHEIKIFV
jgi:hypothetical protein